MAETWNIDPTHSSVLFSVRHLVIAKVHGKFTKFSGTLSAENGKVTGAKVSIDANSIDPPRRSVTGTSSRPTSSTPRSSPLWSSSPSASRAPARSSRSWATCRCTA